MKAENTPATDVKQDLPKKIGTSQPPSPISSFVNQRQYLILTIQLKEAEVSDSTLFPNRTAFAIITNNFGISHKTNKLQFQERRVNDNVNSALYMNLKRTSQMKFYYELKSPEKQSSAKRIQNGEQSKIKNSSESSLNKFTFRKNNLRNILITLNSDQLLTNKAVNKPLFALINPRYFTQIPLRKKKYFSFPLIMEEEGESHLKGEIKIKMKVDLDYDTETMHKQGAYIEIPENKKMECLKNANRPIVSQAITIKPEYFMEDNHSISFDEDDGLGLLGKFQLINKKYEQNTENRHQNVSVWKSSASEREQPPFERISQRPDEEES